MVMLSVIIPCYNAAETIGIQLEALADQQWSEPWEIVVVDNLSTDYSRAVVKQYQEKLENLRLVDAFAQQGQPYACNVGVQTARGELLAFCDADDEIGPGWVAAMGEALSRYGLVAGRLDSEKLNEKWVQESRNSAQQMGLQQFYPSYLPYAAGANFGVKRALYEIVGGFDESLPFNDIDFIWRVQLTGASIHFVPESLVHYRYRDTLSGIYRQALSYGEFHVLIYKRYRSMGMSKLPLRTGIKPWAIVLMRLLGIRDKTSYARWLWMFGLRMGRFHGSIKHRVYAL
jgi:glycosyltransferase involved in cell wall biosynthesis